MALLTVSEKFAGATYAKSVALEEEIEDDTEDAAENVAEDATEDATEDERDDATDEATEVAAGLVAEDVTEDVAKSPLDEPASDCSLEDMLTIWESLDSENSEATTEDESLEQLQNIPAVKNVAAKTPEESLYIGSSIEQKT